MKLSIQNGCLFIVIADWIMSSVASPVASNSIATAMTPEGSGLGLLVSYESVSATVSSTTSSKKISPTTTTSVTSTQTQSKKPSTMSPMSTASPTPPPVRCPDQKDMFGVIWPRTPRNMERRLPCPPSFTGRIIRFCNKAGVWRKPDYSMCVASTIDGLKNTSDNFFNSGEENMEDAMFLVRQLRNLTRPPPRSRRGPFLSQNDLRTVNFVTRDSLRILRSEANSSTYDITEIFGLFSNALDSRNRDTWESLQETESGSEELLSNAEDFASITASRIERQGEVIRFSEENLALRAERILIDGKPEDSIFPNMDDLVNVSIATSDNNTIRIPSQYIKAMAGNTKDVSTAFMLFPTLQDFLPYVDMENDDDISNISIVSVILSAQVIPNNDTEMSEIPSVLTNDPVELIFTIYNVTVDDVSDIICVYWNFSDDFNSTFYGGWVSDGIVTEIIDDSTVRCLSSHLTSFAVLVDVSGKHRQNQNETDPIARQTLSFISYIGCTISIACLIATIIFLLTLGKDIFKKVHYFIHLNLAIALLFGLIVFVSGINFASDYEISCKLVAALLHFFFLSVFCWMLCEAIMMYLLIVIVFSTLSTKWYLYLILGWGLPLSIVAITFGASFDGYVDESSICWLNYSNNIIWTFTAPMCIIILINIIILIVVAVQLYRTKRKFRRMTQTGYHIKDQEKNKQMIAKRRRKSVIDLFKGVLVLLPLLGITWIVGIFAINQYSQFFAWLFTILNSFQGMFIFVFHVLCSQRFQHGVKKLFKKMKANNSESTMIGTQVNKSMDSLDKI